MKRILPWCFLTLALSACGSARIPQPRVARVDLGYTDRKYFAVKHADATRAGEAPRSGWRPSGGWITGRVCGTEVNYDVRHLRRELFLTGFVLPNPVESTDALPGWLFVRDRVGLGGSRREIVGAVGSEINDRNPSSLRRPGVDFWLSPERLEGRLSGRRYWLRAEGDRYVGTVQLEAGGPRVPFQIRGRAALWSMPAADQAAILPLMLTCIRFNRAQFGAAITTVSFDGLVEGEEERD